MADTVPARPVRHLLIANRGEIAVRVARAAAALGIRTHALYARDDAHAGHVGQADHAHPLAGEGPAAYLDVAAVVAAGVAAGCDAVHPGYGFLSENAGFARACEAAGLRFVGPEAQTLDALGDKARARSLARSLGVPVIDGSDTPVDLAQARAFLDALPAGAALVLKALAGGGGRGIRVVREAAALEAAWEACRAEAQQAFGDGRLYLERLLDTVRHVEVQVIGEGHGEPVVLGERECSLQRSRQKLVEVAPAPGLAPELRAALHGAALSLARAVRLRSLATFEFLVPHGGSPAFAFIEANPRLQVEHTVTEAVTGLDLVGLQLELAGGRSLAQLGLAPGVLPPSRGMALQVRVNAEVPGPAGVRPATGTLRRLDLPAGPGVRVDSAARAGERANARYDTLLAKVVVWQPQEDLAGVLARARRALWELRVEGVACNRDFLLRLLDLPAVQAGQWDTELVGREQADLCIPLPSTGAGTGATAAPVDPLAILTLGHATAPPPDESFAPEEDGEDDPHRVRAPVPGTVATLQVAVGDTVRAGQALVLVESMKMQFAVEAARDGQVTALHVRPGDTVAEGALLVELEPVAAAGAAAAAAGPAVGARADLAELAARRALTQDAARPEAVARRHALGLRTARENIEDLCDPGSFHEYGAFAVAAQASRRSAADLQARTPADGLVMGIGQVNGAQFAPERARCAVMSYDYTVLAGTQGMRNHEKKDRLLEIAARWRLPLVAFAEGGGGRPGDTDIPVSGMLDLKAFTLLAQLSGLVPMVAVVAGRCFAGNAVVAGCCDVIIATRGSSIGMGGPAMIEGGGLGRFHPDAVGPSAVQRRNGVIDLVVEDEAQAVQAARRYLSYFQGPLAHWDCAPQEALRHVVPEDRVRAYDVRRVIELLCDRDSVLELRRDFGRGMVTALVRIEGRPMGLIANNPMVLGGAIDADAADKTARFLQLCDAFDLPVLSLCDTPGNMVGPQAERTALVRHCCRLYVIGANLSVPMFSVVLRKAYGLGAQGMVGGSFHQPFFGVAWPTAEFGAMNLEGAVKLGFRRELEAIEDPVQRRTAFEAMVAEAYARGRALSAASLFEIDDVIDPARTRDWISAGLRALPPRAPREGKKRPWVDSW